MSMREQGNSRHNVDALSDSMYFPSCQKDKLVHVNGQCNHLYEERGTMFENIRLSYLRIVLH